MTVLLLGVDYRPMRVIPTRRAVTLILAGKAEVVLADPEGVPIRSASLELERPSVVRLRDAVRIPFRRVPLSRRALLVRDGGECQIRGCEQAGSTMDHVLPRCKGGSTVWENIALMCGYHNHRKADRTLAELGWRLKREPFEPRRYLLLLDRDTLPATWEPFLAAA
jgi:5-methylcytosine-specific restriction endonuclease McrA